jgi:hypothetical protein
VGRLIRSTLFAAGAAALLASTACHSPVSEHWGEAYHANQTQQIADPAAGTQPADPSPGLDGTTVDRVLSEHRKPIGEKAEPRQQTTILEIGS